MCRSIEGEIDHFIQIPIDSFLFSPCEAQYKTCQSIVFISLCTVAKDKGDDQSIFPIFFCINRNYIFALDKIGERRKLLVSCNIG